MRHVLRVSTLMLLCIALALSLVPEQASSQGWGRRPGQGQAAARQGENSLEDLLRRLGEDDDQLAGEIKQAIDDGCDYLLSIQQPDGSFNSYRNYFIGFSMGGTALPLLALKKSMVGLYEGDERELDREIRRLERDLERGRVDSEMAAEERLDYLQNRARGEIERRERLARAVERGLEWLRGEYRRLASQPPAGLPGGDKYRTYCIGVTLMLLEAVYTERQEEDGEYVMQVNRRAIPPQDNRWAREMVAWLERCQQTNARDNARLAVWRYPGNADGIENIDNSNTQYAALGLKAAARMGISLSRPEPWVQVCQYYIRTQDPDGPAVQRRPVAQDPNTGEYHFPPSYRDEMPEDHARGWGYHTERDSAHPTTGAMTTAGLAALVTARSELYEMGYLPRQNPELDEQIDRAINDGICWLGHYFSVTNNPTADRGMPSWHYYYLYGLERAGVLCQQEFFGQHSWYLEGARFLIRQQRDDGSWDSGSTPMQAGGTQLDGQISDTAFAILFLKRATTPIPTPLNVQRPVITEGGEDGDE